MVGTEGVEPPTSTTSMWRSSQLSYVPICYMIKYNGCVLKSQVISKRHVIYDINILLW